jgi:cytochrome bd ubiquinol oxidase subunit I
MAMIVLAALGLYLSLRGRIADTDRRLSRWWLWVLPWAIALPFIANTTGWILTEMGRQPWVVFSLMATADGVSPAVPTGYVVGSLVGFTAVYGSLLVVTIGLILLQIRKGPPEAVDEDLDDEHRTFAPLGSY